MKLTGTLYPISLNGKSIYSGWYAMKDTNGQYYLLERHFSFTSNYKRRLYLADEVSRFIVTELGYVQMKRKRKRYGVGVAIVIAAMIRSVLNKWVPMSFIFGPDNRHLNVLPGFLQIACMLIIVSFSVLGRLYYKKRKLMAIMPNVTCIGYVKLSKPLKTLKNGREFW